MAIAIFTALVLTSYDIPVAFAVMLLAVTFCVWRFGIIPGLLACGIAIVSLNFFFLRPIYSFGLEGQEFSRFLIYTVAILMVWLLGMAQHRSQRKLNESEAYPADAQALSRTGSVSFLSPDGGVFWSAEAYRIFGYDKPVSPSTWLMLKRIHPDDAALAETGFYQLSEPKQSIEFEHRMLMPDDSVKHVSIRGKAEFEKTGKLRVSGAIMDITVAKLTKDNLQKSQAELAHVARLTTMGELVVSIAHEINQPLAAIQTNGEAGLRWLNRESPELDQVRICLTRAVGNAVRAAELIRRTRSMTKKAEIEFKWVNLNEIINDIIQLLHGEADERHIRLSADLTPDIPMMRGDEIQIQQILMNLCMNGFEAMLATPEPRRLLVLRSRHLDDSAILEIRDTGPGIGQASEAQLFSSFFTTKAQGMGMGLSICRSIAESHGGRIEAFNNEDTGATFRVTFPVGRHSQKSGDLAAISSEGKTNRQMVSPAAD